MTPEQFAYWLQGFVELNGGNLPSDAQWQSIKDHLQSLFHKMTPKVATGPLCAQPNEMLNRNPGEMLDRNPGEMLNPYFQQPGTVRYIC